MLIYSSAKDNCYLLFASEENTVSLWARSLAASIEVSYVALAAVFGLDQCTLVCVGLCRKLCIAAVSSPPYDE